MGTEIKLLNGGATAGNANRDWVVPDNVNYTVLYGQVKLTTDATVADRRVILQVLDESSNVIIDFHSGAVVAASASDQHHEFMQGIYRETSFVGNALQVPISNDLTLKSGWTLRVDVENGVAGDSYIPYVVVREG